MTIDTPNEDGPLHLIYYAPKNPKYSGSSIEGERPPCVLDVHGGPTSLLDKADTVLHNLGGKSFSPTSRDKLIDNSFIGWV